MNISYALLTDLYQLTMASSYFQKGYQNIEAVFHLFYRRAPFNGGFTITSGLQAAIDHLKNFSFQEEDISYLATLKNPDLSPLFPQEFLKYLENFTFSCDIDAMEEGSIAFPYEPLVRVKGPLIEAQIIETLLLNTLNFPTLIATKAARICLAANKNPVVEFGLRRAQGQDGGITASRASYIGGCEATSNFLAGKLFGIPVKGTHAHSYVMIFPSELEAFLAYADTNPSNCVLLLDTYNTVKAIEHAIETGHRLRAKGYALAGVRLDSGDLTYLSCLCRKKLDDAGFKETKIIATNDLNENIIQDLRVQGAKIDSFGVGTSLVTAFDHPALDGVYKLSAIKHPNQEWQYRLKLSEQMHKISNPGILQVRRFSNNEGIYLSDAIYDIHSNIDQGCIIIDPFDPTRQKSLKKELASKDLLIPIFRKGQCVYSCPNIHSIRDRVKIELTKLDPTIKRLVNPHTYIVGLEKTIYDFKVSLIKNIRKKFE
jgi:nicotinate phosphoribosyltransferase